MTTGPGAAPPVGRSSARSVAQRILSTLVTAGFFVVVVIVAWDRRDELSELTNDPGPELVALAGLVLVGHFLNSTEFWVLYRAQGARLGMGETWLVFLANQFGNLAPGQLGTLHRFRYLRVVHDFDYARSTSNFGANLAVSLASSAIVGLGGLCLVEASGDDVAPLLVLIGLGLAAASLVLFLLPLPTFDDATGSVGRQWRRFVDGWEAVRGHHRAVATVLVLDVAKYLLVALRFDIAFNLLGVDQSYPYFMVIAPAAGLAGMLSFTPGGLGIREAFITGTAVAMGSDLDTGLLAATVDRGVMLVVSLVGGSIGMWWTRRRMTTALAATLSSAGGLSRRDDGPTGTPPPTA